MIDKKNLKKKFLVINNLKIISLILKWYKFKYY